MDLPPEITQPREYLLAAIRRRWMREPIADFVDNNRAILDTGKAELDRAKANPDSRLRVSIAALQRSLAVDLAACELEVQSELLVMRDANRLLGEDSPHRGAALHSVFAGAASEERFALLLDKLQPRTPRPRSSKPRQGQTRQGQAPSVPVPLQSERTNQLQKPVQSERSQEGQVPKVPVPGHDDPVALLNLASDANEDWLKALMTWEEAGSKGQPPRYSQDVLRQLEQCAAHNAEVAEFLTKQKHLIAWTESVMRGPGVPAPAEA